MKRYNTKHFWRMKESEAGEWVRFSEVETLKARHEEEIASRNDWIDTLSTDVSYCKEIIEVYKAKEVKANNRANFYQARLELLGNTSVALTVIGVIGCLAYSFNW